MKARIEKVIYDPVKARVLFDIGSSLIIFLTIYTLFFLFRFYNHFPLEAITYPLLFGTCNFALGVYTINKMAPVMKKTLLLSASGVSSLAILLLLNTFNLPLIISALFTVIIAIAPRAFFNFSNTYASKNTLIDIIIHSNDPILLVGGGGYIGSVTIEKLLKKNYKVRVLDKFLYGKNVFDNISHKNRLELIEGDATNLSQLSYALRNVQGVIHLAGIVGDPASAIDEKLTRHMNIISTRILKESIKAFRIPKFIFASSCSVYGASNKILNEESKLKPASLYAQSKIDSENEILHDTFDEFHPTILRFATVFGHSRKPRFDLVVNLFVAQAFHNGEIIVINGKQWRPFIHTEDAADAIIKVIESPSEIVGRKIFNVGDDNFNYQIEEVARKIEKAVAKYKKIRIITRNTKEDIRNYQVSFKKIYSILGFHSSISFEDGILQMYQNFKNKVYKKKYTDPYYSNLEMTKLMLKQFNTQKYRKSHLTEIMY